MIATKSRTFVLSSEPILFATFGVAAFVLTAFPQIDLAVSRWCANDQNLFVPEYQISTHRLSVVVSWLGRALAAICLAALLASFVPAMRRYRFGRQLVLRRSAVACVLVSFALGPGLLVNEVFKRHWGRARPADIVQFGGHREFSGAFVIAHQCDHNCSFVSGDAALATLPVAGYFIARSRRSRRTWLTVGLVGGLAIGFARIVSGHHFLSDVLIAMGITYAVTALSAIWFLGRQPPPS